MATHSSILAWRIPGTGEPGGLLSMGSQRVGHKKEKKKEKSFLKRYSSFWKVRNWVTPSQSKF